ncbi:hypothetical protein C1H46_040409 [Malus baccata]|uniref:Uncharacterized protein n=1 Tax=Malus baccata TaxID=106549 RepID=A0A540KIK3_MALBA|nr:hypothetical protein C1H46_040409 [Malus baccata]
MSTLISILFEDIIRSSIQGLNGFLLFGIADGGPLYRPLPLPPLSFPRNLPCSMIRRSTLLSILFEDIIRSSIQVMCELAILSFNLHDEHYYCDDEANLGSTIDKQIQSICGKSDRYFHAIRDLRHFKLQRGVREPLGRVPELEKSKS